jgi:hypothetical protein
MAQQFPSPPTEEIEHLVQDKLEAKHQIGLVLDRYARLHGVSPADVGAALHRYIDDMLDDLFAQTEQALGRKDEGAPDVR